MRVLRAIILVTLVINLEFLGVKLSHAQTPVKVAILDSGSNAAYKEGISLIDGSVKDYNGHGTLIAGIVKEMYPEAELYVVKVAGKDGLVINEEAVAFGLEWAISRGVNVINMSLRLKDSERLHNLIKKAHQQGIVIVAAAGNNSTRLGLLTAKGSIKLSEVAYPAKYNEVIAVGALNRQGKIYAGTIIDKEIDVFFRGYKGKNAGTSIASAYAAGYAAKIISRQPNLNIQEIKEILQQQAM